MSSPDLSQKKGFEAYSRYQHTWQSKTFLGLEHDVIGLFFGNRTGKNAVVVIGYMFRWLGWHPVPEKNVTYAYCSNGHKFSPYVAVNIKDGLCPKCPVGSKKGIRQYVRNDKVYRFISHTLPGSEQRDKRGLNKVGSVEVKNTQWPELKKWLPPFMIKGVPSTRSATAIIGDVYGGKNIVIDFCSYKQSVDDLKGQDRCSVWSDEVARAEIYEENMGRLVQEPGADMICSYTVTDETKSTVLYDMIYDRASDIYRSKTIRNEYYKKKLNKIVPEIEHTESPYSIAVIHAATDDNPILDKDRIERFLMTFDDPVARMMRRYCVWSQISSRIFQGFNWKVHCIDGNKYFSEDALMAGVN